MYWRRFLVSDIPLDDQKDFETWLLARWREKDQLLDEFFETGRFPTDLGSLVLPKGVTVGQQAEAARGYVETDIRLAHWLEIAQIFAVPAGLALFFRKLFRSS
jgi:hypothetical protein